MRLGWFCLLPFVFACATLTREEIASRGNRGDRAALVKWLGDDRSWVREEAAHALGRSRDSEAASALSARLLDNNEKTWVRAASAEALGAIGDQQAVPLLAGLAVRPDTAPELTLALLKALCAYPGDEPLSAIAPLAGNEDLLVAAMASAELSTACGRAAR